MDSEVPNLGDLNGGMGILNSFDIFDEDFTEVNGSSSYQSPSKKIKIEPNYHQGFRSSEKPAYPIDIKPPLSPDHSSYMNPHLLVNSRAPSNILPSSYPIKNSRNKRMIPNITPRGYTGYTMRQNNDETKTRRCPNPGRRGPRGKSNYRGVCITREGKWRSVIYKDRKQVYLGVYDSELEAAQAYDRASREYFGENANLNLPNEVPPDLGPIVLPSAAKAEKSAAQKSTQQPSIKIQVPKPTPKIAASQTLDHSLDYASIFDPSDSNLLDGPILGDSDIGPMSPIPSLFEGEWHDMCFV